MSSNGQFPHNPGWKPWKPGESGNPAGRPKSNKEHVETARYWATAALDLIGARIQDGQMSNEDLIRAYGALADRGGFLPAEKTIGLEMARIRTAIALLGLDALTPQQRDAIIQHLRERDPSAGEIAAAPAP